MGDPLFQDEWVTVDLKSVHCGGAVYSTVAVDGARVVRVRENAAGKWLGATALLVACNYAVCAVFESGRDALFGVLGFAAICFGWAFWLAPVFYYVVIGVSGREVTLARYTKHEDANKAAQSILDAAGLARRSNRP